MKNHWLRKKNWVVKLYQGGPFLSRHWIDEKPYAKVIEWEFSQEVQVDGVSVFDADGLLLYDQTFPPGMFLSPGSILTLTMP